MEKLQNVVNAVGVEPVFLLYYTSYGLRSILLSTLWYVKVCANYYPSYICDDLTNENYTEYERKVQKYASRWGFYDEVVYLIPGLFVTLVMSSWSEKINRKIPMVLGPGGLILVTLTYIPNAIYLEGHLAFMLFGAFLHGLSGGFMLLFSMCISYLTAVTTKETRTMRIALAEAMMVVGGAIADFASGHLLQALGFVYCFVICVCLALACIAYILVNIKNVSNIDNEVERNNEKGEKEATSNGHIQDLSKTLNPETVKTEQKASDVRKKFKWEYVYGGFLALGKPREGTRRKQLFLIVAIFVGELFFANGAHGISYLFLRNPPLSWDPTLYGYYTGYYTAMSCVCMLVVVPVLSRVLKVKDTIIIILATCSVTFAHLWFGLSVHTWMVFLYPLIRFFGGGLFICLRSTLTTLVHGHEIGHVLGAVALFEQLGALISGAFFHYFLYPATVDFYAGFCFLLSSGLHIIIIVFAVMLHRYGEQEPIIVMLDEDDLQLENPNYDFQPDLAKLEITLQED